MTKILFVCHGNICRSPMARFIMENLVKKAGVEEQIKVDSARHQHRRNREPDLSSCTAQAGGTWNQLPGTCSTSDEEKRLRPL